MMHLKIKCLMYFGVKISQRDIKACHMVKYNWTIVKFSNRKDYLQVLQVKKQLRNDCDLSNSPVGIQLFINENLCSYYKGLWINQTQSSQK